MTLISIKTFDDLDEISQISQRTVLMQSLHLFGDSDFHQTEIMFTGEEYFWAKFKDVKGQWIRKMFFYSYYSCNTIFNSY